MGRFLPFTVNADMTIPVASSSSTVGADTSNAAPRISVFYLILWTSCSAIFIATWNFIQSGYQAEGKAPVVTAAFESLQVAVTGMIAGMTTSAALVWIWCQCFGPRFPRHPGHFILLPSALMLFGSLPLALAHVFLSEQTWGAYPQTMGELPKVLVVACLWSIVLRMTGLAIWISGWRDVRRSDESRHWSRYFSVMIFFSLVTVLIEVTVTITLAGVYARGADAMFTLTPYNSTAFGSPFALLHFALLSRFLYLDRKRDVPRDWFHWVGIASVAFDILMFLPLVSFGLNL